MPAKERETISPSARNVPAANSTAVRPVRRGVTTTQSARNGTDEYARHVPEAGTSFSVPRYTRSVATVVSARPTVTVVRSAGSFTLP